MHQSSNKREQEPDYTAVNVINTQTDLISGKLTVVLSFLFLFAISLPLTQIDTEFSYVFITFTYLLILLIAAQNISNIKISRIYIVLIGLLSSSIILSGLASPSTSSFLRLGGFTIFTLSNLLIIPSVIPFRNMIYTTSRYTAGLAILGFLSYFGIQSLFWLFDLSLWGADLYLYPELSPITSIFINPNALGFVLLTGCIAALIEAVTTRRRIAVALVFFNANALLFTNYRTGMVSFAIVLMLFLTYMLLDRQKYTATVIGGLMTTLLLLMGVFELIPSPAWLTDLSLNGRKVLWQETVIAIQETSLLGVGFGNYTTVVNNPHNSYLRMFLALGITGGVIYAIIIMRSILQSARQATNLGTLSISLYLVAFWYVQMANSLTFIGISFHSAFISLLIGYHIWSDSIVNSEPERVTEA